MKSCNDGKIMDFYIRSKKNNYSAKLTYIDGQYILRKGSTVSCNVSDRFKSYKAVIKKRKKAGVIQDDLLLKFDITFNSSSTAGEFVRGGSCNGPSSWKTENGITLKEWIQKV